MPEYEHIFTDFLLSLVQNKYKKRPALPNMSAVNEVSLQA